MKCLHLPSALLETRVYQHMTIKKTHEAEEPSPGCYLIVKGFWESFKNMPRFLSPFRRRDHEAEYSDPQPINPDNYQYRPATPSDNSHRNNSFLRYRHVRLCEFADSEFTNHTRETKPMLMIMERNI